MITDSSSAPQTHRPGVLATETYDVAVYGGTAAAVIAAIQVDRMGLSVILISPDQHLGGMTSGGLGWTDSKDGAAIGGLAREFYHRIWKHYRASEAWTRVERDRYASRVNAQPGKTIDDDRQVMWTFEPHVAEKVLDEWMAETGVIVHRDEWLDRTDVMVVGQHVREIRTLSGRRYAAKVFIDATYEGDLMAAAAVTYRVGRDAADDYGESLNGIYFRKPNSVYYHKDQAYHGISPYRIPGDTASGFIAGLEGDFPASEKEGDGDTRLQAFNYRLCLSAVPENRVSIKCPEGYNDADYELLFRMYEAGHPSGFSAQEMPNGKTDSNNFGFMSLDYVGGNFSIAEGWNYSESDYERRRSIIMDHRRYTQGLLWTIMNHPRIPEKARLEWSRHGLAADEFTDNGNWPHQLYVREARRMVGLAVMTQHHVDGKAGQEIADSIGLGSYSLDSHGVRRVVIDGKIRVEGGFYVSQNKPYPIGYGAIVPRRNEVRNLLVPVTLSATHAAFGSLRMEPTYMILGQAAGTAAGLAVNQGLPVQDISYDVLRRRLVADGQIVDVSQQAVEGRPRHAQAVPIT